MTWQARPGAGPGRAEAGFSGLGVTLYFNRLLLFVRTVRLFEFFLIDLLSDLFTDGSRTYNNARGGRLNGWSPLISGTLL